MSARRRPAHPPRPPRALGRGRAWILVALVAFVLVDIVLVGLALAAHRSTGPRKHGPIPTFSSAPDTPAPTRPTAPSTASSSALAGQVTPLAPRFLLATTATDGWRASSGSCTGTSAVLQHTTDAGATWTAVKTGASDIREVLALGGNSARVWIAGTVKTPGAGAAGCTPHFYASYTEGRFWSEYPEELPAAAYIDTGKGTLHVPSGSENPPCEHPQHVVGRPSTAVLCPGALFEQHAADAWVKASVPGVVAMTASDSGYIVAVSGAADCDGLAIESLPTPVVANEHPEELSCVPSPVARTVTLASAGESLWLWNGSTVSVSQDGGKHW